MNTEYGFASIYVLSLEDQREIPQPKEEIVYGAMPPHTPHSLKALLSAGDTLLNMFTHSNDHSPHGHKFTFNTRHKTDKAL